MKGFALASLAVVGVAGTPNIVQLAQSVDALSTLVTAVVAGGLADTLSSAGPFTVFAPTNEAFGSSIQGDTLTKLLKPENKDVLVEILTNHVVSGRYGAKNLFNRHYTNPLKTLYGGILSTDYFGSQSPKSVWCEGAGLCAQVCVVIPPVPFIFNRRLVCRNLTQAGSDNQASNGIVHLIDGVLVPDYGKLTLENKVATADIVALAQSVPDLSTLVTAVVTGELVDTLKSAGLTVFAPTNEAFAALPDDVLTYLLKPEGKATLVGILSYHVVPDQVAAKDIPFGYPYASGDKAPVPENGNFRLISNVEGTPLKVVSSNGKIMVGGKMGEFRTVISPDNLATNGVVHLIDGVMLPVKEAGPTIRLTSFTSKYDCSGSVKTSFDIKEGGCYALNKVNVTEQDRDQRVVCQPNGDAYVLHYASHDGSCTKESIGFTGRTYVKKDSCYEYLKIDCDPPSAIVV